MGIDATVKQNPPPKAKGTSYRDLELTDVMASKLCIESYKEMIKYHQILCYTRTSQKQQQFGRTICVTSYCDIL